MFLCRFSVRCRRILGFGGRCRLRLGPAAINLNVIYNSFGPFHCWGSFFSVGSSMDGAEWVTRPLNRLSSRTFEWLPWFIRLWFAGGKGHAFQRPRGATTCGIWSLEYGACNYFQTTTTMKSCCLQLVRQSGFYWILPDGFWDFLFRDFSLWWFRCRNPSRMCDFVENSWEQNGLSWFGFGRVRNRYRQLGCCFRWNWLTTMTQDVTLWAQLRNHCAMLIFESSRNARK